MQFSKTRIGVLVIASGMCMSAVAAQAATIIVTSDSGGTGGPDCTLRDAITAANTDMPTGGCPAGNGADIIELPVGATITLTEVDNETFGHNGLPSVTSVVTINGNGATVQRDATDGTPDFRIIYVAEGGDLTLNDLTVSRGFAHISFPERYGGGIYNVGTLTLANCTVNVNTAALGGGIFNDTTGTLTLTNSTISGNGVGGLFSAGGGILNAGTLTLADSTVSGNTVAGLAGSGGGILNDGTLTLADSTVSGNQANSGGGIINFGTLTLTNCTVSGNTAGNFDGGGISNNSGTLTLTNTTVSGNTAAECGGGIFNLQGTLTLRHSIVANSTDGADCDNDDGTVTDDGYNIVEDGTCITAETSMMGDPMLGPLQNNGGPTATHALLKGSPVIDAIPDVDCAVDTDQRGVPRPHGDGCDIGSYEALSTAAVHVDIKPGSCPNPLNRSSNGVLPIALLGRDDFDVSQVHLANIQLSRKDGVGGSVAPHEGPPGPHSVFADVATPLDGEKCECHDLLGDGTVDVSMKFRTQDVVDALQLTDLLGGQFVALVLTGDLIDGTPFMAEDCIWLVPPEDIEPANAVIESNTSDAFVEITPLDLNFDSDGFTNFARAYVPETVVMLTAEPVSPGGHNFLRWIIDGVAQPVGEGTIDVTITDDLILEPVYGVCQADLDGDGSVNAADLAPLLGAWGPNPGHLADINGDGVVNAADLALLLGSWGRCD